MLLYVSTILTHFEKPLVFFMSTKKSFSFSIFFMCKFTVTFSSVSPCICYTQFFLQGKLWKHSAFQIMLTFIRSSSNPSIYLTACPLMSPEHITKSTLCVFHSFFYSYKDCFSSNMCILIINGFLVIFNILHFLFITLLV